MAYLVKRMPAAAPRSASPPPPPPGSAPRVATQQPAIPDASDPTPAPDDLHPIVARALMPLKKDSGFTPIVYLKNGNQYWVKVRP